MLVVWVYWAVWYGTVVSLALNIDWNLDIGSKVVKEHKERSIGKKDSYG